jgi:hypothetical protein
VRLSRSASPAGASRAFFLGSAAAEQGLLDPVTMTSPVLPDGSYLAEVPGDGATTTVRVIEYHADAGGQLVPEMSCLVTGLLDWEEYPAAGLARLYRWRWDGPEAALRAAKAPLHGAGPGTGPWSRPAGGAARRPRPCPEPQRRQGQFKPNGIGSQRPARRERLPRDPLIHE